MYYSVILRRQSGKQECKTEWLEAPHDYRENQTTVGVSCLVFVPSASTFMYIGTSLLGVKKKSAGIRMHENPDGVYKALNSKLVSTEPSVQGHHPEPTQQQET